MSRKRPKKGINDLETLFPEIAKEFHPTKNGELKPSDFFARSNRVVWWLCPNGHEYDMMINNRTGTKQQNCPICSGKRIIKGLNDFPTTNPELMDRWDYEKNTDLDPYTLGPGSNKYAWWKCEHGHSFRSMVYRMVQSWKGMNCPVCRNFKVQEGENDLTTTHPHLLKEWDYSKNKVLPTQVIAGTNKKVWWKCGHGHSWEAVVASRALRNLGCPYCSHQKLLPGFNDVATLHPEILDYWDYEKNEKPPSEFIGEYSNKEIWLKCEKGHSFKSRIAEFCRGNRCPVCANKKIEIGYNDLATTHPSLVKEWDYEKNIDITPQEVTRGSDKKVWWKCEKGHSWKAVISSRVAGRGCPHCLKEYQVSLTEKAFSFYLSKYFKVVIENIHLDCMKKKELDIYIPTLRLAVEYDGHQWHKSAKRDLEKDLLCKENGITLIRIREDGCAKYESPAHFIECKQTHGNIVQLKEPINEMIELINNLFSLKIPLVDSIENDVTAINESFYSYNKANSLAYKKPALLTEWDYEKNGQLKPDMISAGSNSKVWWKCKHGHSWLAVVSSRVRGNGCPYCNGKYVLTGFNDLASQYPNLVEEWDYELNKDLDPTKILATSNTIAYWKCKHGHSWKTKISTRTRMGSGCPTCAGLTPEKGKNDFATLYPELAKEWDYEKNGGLKPSDVLPGSEKRVWWICPKGHSYDTLVAVRAKMNCGCPVCSNKRIQAGYNDLATLHPELVEEWDFEKNGDLLPTQVGGNGGSHKEIWWKCKKGHSWKTKLSTRISLHTGCPQCAIDRNKKR